MSRIVVERTFESPQSDGDMAEAGARSRPCKEIYGVTWKRTLLSNDRRRMVCEYEAPDAEAVRKVQREAGLPFDRIYPAEVVE
ncbi:MAG: DUF4242 domain-containing protein [Solirubrobacterales bacterium]|nr:DUF4242 domain-containing protein [Solirubrobacterales bacterium]